MKTQKILLSLLVCSTLFLGCTAGKKAASSDPAAPAAASTNLNVSGTLNTGNAQLMAGLKSSARLSSLVDLSTYKVLCSTATNPPLSASGNVAANGTFSLSVPGALNQPLVCYLTDADGAKVADFLVADAAKKDLNGNSSVANTTTFASAVAFGAVTFDPDSGEVTVPIGQLAGSIATGSPASADVFDPSGTWTIGPVDFALPHGVRSTCTEQENQSNECNGPPDGQAIFFKLWKARRTADNSTENFMQLWAPESGTDPAAAFATCGSKVGLTAQTKADLGLDFSAYGAADDIFTMTTSLTDFDDKASGNQHENVASLVDGWKMEDVATSQWNMQTGCSSKNVSIGGVSYNGWLCGPDQNSRYQLGLSGGCLDTAGKPVDVNDWSKVSANADGTGGQAQSANSVVDANMIQRSSMSGFYNGTVATPGTAVTCSSAWSVTDAEGVPQGTQQLPAQFDWNQFQAGQTTINAGALCSSLANNASSDERKVMQLQCYSNYYYQSGLQRTGGLCVPRIQTDWTQTDPAKFVHVDFRPSSLVFMDHYKPFADGNGGSMLTRQEHYRGVQVNSSWVNCHVIDTGGITMKKVSATKILATYQSSEVTTSKDIPACAAQFTGKKTTFFFYLNK